MENRENQSAAEARLDQLFHAYRDAWAEPETGANYMPALWAKIEERQRSSNWFGHFAKGLVTAAVAAYLIILMVSSSPGVSSAYYNGLYNNGTFVDAMVADHISSLEPLHLDRISHLERSLAGHDPE